MKLFFCFFFFIEEQSKYVNHGKVNYNHDDVGVFDLIRFSMWWNGSEREKYEGLLTVKFQKRMLSYASHFLWIFGVA